MENPRQIAARVLIQHQQTSEFAEDLLDHELAKVTLAPHDRALVTELVFGIVRSRATLDWLIERKTEGRTQKVPLQVLLRLGLYQIFWLDRIPDHAAVHETVEQAKQLGFGPQSGFINAVLRGYLREHDSTRQLLADLKNAQPALGFSQPDWLCRRWETRWGAEKTRRLLEWNNTAPPTYARLNALKSDAAMLQERWREEGVTFTPEQFDWTSPQQVYRLGHHPSLASLPSFAGGLFYIQDPSTLLAVRQLDPQPNEAILDCCAAPGGKTVFIAELMGNRGFIMAQDVDIRRRQLIQQNCDRLGVRCVQISRGTTTINPDLSQPFDRILVDAPCSNTGVMRRRVDLRWRIRVEELARLQEMQLELLRQAAPQLAKNGTLVYSTCSLEPEENEELIRRFLAEQPEFTLQAERTLLPFTENVDGAYVARLRKG